MLVTGPPGTMGSVFFGEKKDFFLRSFWEGDAAFGGASGGGGAIGAR